MEIYLEVYVDDHSHDPTLRVDTSADKVAGDMTTDMTQPHTLKIDIILCN